MKNKVAFLTLGLTVFSVTFTIYTLANETLTRQNAEYQSVLLIKNNQLIPGYIASVSSLPATRTRHRLLYSTHNSQGCERQSIEKYTPILYL